MLGLCNRHEAHSEDPPFDEISITSPPCGHQILPRGQTDQPTSKIGSDPAQPPPPFFLFFFFSLLVYKFLFLAQALNTFLPPPLPPRPNPPLINSLSNSKKMAGSLIYDSTLIQLLPSRSRRHDQMLYQDSPNLAAAPHHHHIDRRSSTPHQRLPPHPNDQPRSRSERSRKALSIPVRNSPSTNPNYFRSPHPGDIGPLSQQHQPGLPWVHDEIIAEFSPRDQLALDHVIANNIRRPLPAQNPLPPRLKQPNPRQPRSRNWRSNDAESLPPRFRSPHSTPGPRVPSPPFNPPWNRPPHAHLSRVDVSNNLAVLSNLPPQHLSSFLQSNVSYRPQQIIDTRRAQESKRIDISLNAKTLAPIGAERAQLLASNPRLSVVNDCTPHNSRHSLPYSYDPLLQTLRPSHHLSTRTPQFVPTGPSQLEKLYNRLKRSPNVSRILSPLNPIRNPESLVPSDAKWYKDERETRKRRILTSLDTSAFARRAIDRRSRT